MPQYSRMVCLVGEDPLPNWLGIQQFMPSIDASKGDGEKPVVRLIYSKQTYVVARNLYNQLEEERKNRLHEIDCLLDSAGEVSNAFSPRSMTDTIAKLGDLTGYALNYTGGTKV